LFHASARLVFFFSSSFHYVSIPVFLPSLLPSSLFLSFHSPLFVSCFSSPGLSFLLPVITFLFLSSFLTYFFPFFPLCLFHASALLVFLSFLLSLRFSFCLPSFTTHHVPTIYVSVIRNQI
jgi:hypothetical protein